MSLTVHLGAVVSVVLVATGQVLFKRVALALAGGSPLLGRDVVLLGGTALAIYGGATLLWIHLLRSAPLGRLYPYMALSFVMVTLAGATLFDERIGVAHWAGLALIVGGLVVIASAEP